MTFCSTITAQIETERKKIEALSAMTWDDPMAVDWGDASAAAAEPTEEEPMASPPPETSARQERERQPSWPNEAAAGIKCVAIYTYQVMTAKAVVKVRHKLQKFSIPPKRPQTLTN